MINKSQLSGWIAHGMLLFHKVNFRELLKPPRLLLMPPCDLQSRDLKFYARCRSI